MKHHAILLSALIAAFVLAAAPADARAPHTDRPSPAPVINQIVDLLKTPVTLTAGPDGTTWTSRVFDTSAFTRIGLRIAGGEIEGGALFCGISWQYAPEDKPQREQPSVSLGGQPRVQYLRGPMYFGPVKGLLAHVTCWADPPGGSEQQPAAGELTGVKILLRRE